MESGVRLSAEDSLAGDNFAFDKMLSPKRMSSFVDTKVDLSPNSVKSDEFNLASYHSTTKHGSKLNKLLQSLTAKQTPTNRLLEGYPIES